MTTEVDTLGPVDATFASCQECAEERGIATLLWFYLKQLVGLERSIALMKARTHEEKTGHHVLVVNQRTYQ